MCSGEYILHRDTAFVSSGPWVSNNWAPSIVMGKAVRAAEPKQGMLD